MLICLKQDNNVSLKNPQFGFVVSKKIGNAVYRHKFTRLLRNISMDAVNELNIKDLPIQIQYVAFEFCDDYSILKKEFYKQIKSVL